MGELCTMPDHQQTSFATRFEQYLRNPCRLAPGRPVLLACSGGLDSAVLGELLADRKQPFAVAHVQYSLRGDDSLADEALARELADRWGVRFYREDLDAAARAESGPESLQMAAREMRYAWFEEIRAAEGFHRIATAHHADDQVETLMLRLLGGSGLRGLRGIRPLREKLIRPLLFARKWELLEFARQRSLPWREDRSNISPDYLRNRIRHELLPVAENLNPTAISGIIRASAQLREAEALYETGLRQLTRSLVKQKGEEWHIGIRGLEESGAASTLLREWLLPFGFSAAQLDEVVRGMGGQPGGFWPSPQGVLYRERRCLVWVPGPPREKPLPAEINAIPAVARIGGWRFDFQEVEKDRIKKPDADRGVLLDASTLVPPLLLRPWADGDYFFPEGLGKKRKLKRFLTDKKIPAREKTNSLVLVCGGRIAWVAGHLADERFAGGSKTRKLVKITMEPDHADDPVDK